MSSEHTEQQRHQYLAAMGVTSWLPRAVLPGAKPSPDSVYQFIYGHMDEDFSSDDAPDEMPALSDGEPAHVSSSPAGQRKPQMAPVTAESLHLSPAPSKHPVISNNDSIAPIANNSTASASVDVTPTSADMPQLVIEPRVSKEKAPRFRLGFWLYKDVLVIDSLPLLSRGGIPQGKYQALCANMITAMGLSAELLATPYVLAWPMLAGISLDQGRSEASLAVNHKIQKLLQLSKPRLVLLLGEPAAQMSMQRSESLDELRAVVFNYTSQIKALSSLSLTQMMQIPECKKEVWNDLQKILPLDA